MLCKSKNTKNNKIKKIIITIAAFILAVVVIFEIQAIPFTRKYVKSMSKMYSSKIIAQTIDEIQSKTEFTYSDLVTINYSDSGDVKSISENTINVNKFKSKVTREIQQKLDNKPMYSFGLPIGAFTDVTVLNNVGPEIEINFMLTGSVNCTLKSTFESGGVNQTVHHIKLVVSTDIITISPEYKEQNTFVTDYEIAQTVIVGTTPSTFADIVR